MKDDKDGASKFLIGSMSSTRNAWRVKVKTKWNRKRAGIAAVGALAAAWAAGCAALWATQGSHVFKAHQSRKKEHEHDGGCHECEKRIEIAPDGASLERWVLINSQTPKAPVLIWFAGRGEDISWMLKRVDDLPNWTVVLAQHRGFGRSSGRPSRRKMVEDAIRLIESINTEFDGSKIVVGGRSLGTGVAIEAAEHSAGTVSGCALLTPYASFTELVRMKGPRLFPVTKLLRHKFESAPRAQKMNIPLLSIVAEQDAIIPRESSKRLFEAWGGMKEEHVVKGANHNDVARKEEFWSALNDFANKI